MHILIDTYHGAKNSTSINDSGLTISLKLTGLRSMTSEAKTAERNDKKDSDERRILSRWGWWSLEIERGFSNQVY